MRLLVHRACLLLPHLLTSSRRLLPLLPTHRRCFVRPGPDRHNIGNGVCVTSRAAGQAGADRHRCGHPYSTIVSDLLLISFRRFQCDRPRQSLTPSRTTVTRAVYHLKTHSRLQASANRLLLRLQRLRLLPTIPSPTTNAASYCWRVPLVRTIWGTNEPPPPYQTHLRHCHPSTSIAVI